MFAIPRSRPIKGRRKVRDFNECITCPLCRGYLIDATTINDCLHSFCRSCIVRHLQTSVHCPCCPRSTSSKTVHLAQLRRDPQLKALVYKLVTGLSQSEAQRRQAFDNEHPDGLKPSIANGSPPKSASHADNNDEDGGYDDDDYVGVAANAGNGHLNGGCDDDAEFFAADDPISLSLEYHPVAVAGQDPADIPAPKYLQCPAAVSVQHLQRFLASKFSLNFESCTSGIDIQIINDDDEVLPATFTLMDVAYCAQWRRLEPLKLFYQILVSSTASAHPASADAVTPTTSTSANDTNPGTSPGTNNAGSVYVADDEEEAHEEVEEEEEDDDEDDDEENDDEGATIDSYSISTDKPIKPTKVTLVKSNGKTNGGTVSTPPTPTSSRSPKYATSAASKPNKSKSAHSSPSAHKVSDFKSLRSNDIKYSPPSSTTLSTPSKRPSACTGAPLSPSAPAAASSGTPSSSPPSASSINDIFSSMKRQHEHELRQLQQATRTAAASVARPTAAMTPPPTPSIVVSIPSQLSHRRRNSISEEHFESLSLAKLKTANRKSAKTVPFQHSLSVDDSVLRTLTSSGGTSSSIPKLKIELATLTRVTDPKSPTAEETNESRSAHKKRKKSAKHSRDSGGKRRKLHAEISSQPEPSLKLKLKITASGGGKHERKSSTTSDDSSQSRDAVEMASDVPKPVATPPSPATPTQSQTFNDDADVIITNVSFLPTATQTPTERNNNATFAKPKPMPELRPKAAVATGISSPPKKYLPTMRFNNNNNNNHHTNNSHPTPRSQPPEMRPIINASGVAGRVHGPANGPTYPAVSLTLSDPTSPRLVPINGTNNGSITITSSTTSTTNNNNHTVSATVPHSPAPAAIKRSFSIDSRDLATTPSHSAKRHHGVPNLIRTSPPKHQQQAQIGRPSQVPPCAISVTKMPDMPKLLAGNGVSLQPQSTTHQQQQQFTNRPALEIVRIPATGSTAVESTPMPGKFKPNNFASNVFHAVTAAAAASAARPRPMPPTIALSKIRKMRTGAPMVTAPPQQQSPSSPAQSSSPSTSIHPKLSPSATSCGALDLSGATGARSAAPDSWMRPAAPATKCRTPPRPHQQTPIAYIDITSPTKSESPTKVVPTNKSASPGTSNKMMHMLSGTKSPTTKSESPTKVAAIKQSSPSTSSAMLTIANILSGAKSPATTSGGGLLQHHNPHHMSTNYDLLSRKVHELRANEQRLENLKLLSESAIARERLEVARTAAPPAFATPKPPPTMRQQNASVRNIPNPSALAFRGCGPQSPPKSPPKSPTTSSVVSSTSVDRTTPAATSGGSPPINHSIKMLTTTTAAATAASSSTVSVGSVMPPIPPLIPHSSAASALLAARTATAAAVSSTMRTVSSSSSSVAAAATSGHVVNATVTHVTAANTTGPSSATTTTTTKTTAAVSVPLVAAAHSTVTTSSPSTSSSSASTAATCVTTTTSSSSSPSPSSSKSAASVVVAAVVPQRTANGGSSCETSTTNRNDDVQLIAATSATACSFVGCR